jgi:hypothetical protein
MTQMILIVLKQYKSLRNKMAKDSGKNESPNTPNHPKNPINRIVITEITVVIANNQRITTTTRKIKETTSEVASLPFITSKRKRSSIRGCAFC